jgi:excisionase family DNA binding protein
MQTDTNTLSVGEVAAMLRCTERHVRNLIRDGKLRAAEISRTSSKRPRYRLTRQTVDRFLAAASAPAPQPLRVPPGMVYAPVSKA